MECQQVRSQASGLQDCSSQTMLLTITVRGPTTGGQQITEAHQIVRQYLVGLVPVGKRILWKTFGDPAASRGFARPRYLCT